MLWPWFRSSPEASFEKQIIAGLDEFPSFLFLLSSQKTQNDLQKRVKFGSDFRLKPKQKIKQQKTLMGNINVGAFHLHSSQN